MNKLENELLKNSYYEERIAELEKLNEELKFHLNETKVMVNEIKFKQFNNTSSIDNLW